MSIFEDDIVTPLPAGVKNTLDPKMRNAEFSANPKSWGRSKSAREPVLSSRAQYRRERDIERGYSINVKQVVLAFAVEFWIITLIVAGTYLLIAESDNLSREAVFSALLLPAALAMVELARVPLAIAVRTQEAWHIKLFAAIGVIAAITITSFSLSQIAWKTFDVRIAEATRANDKLTEARYSKDSFLKTQAQANIDLKQKIQTRDDATKRLANLQDQVQKMSHPGQSCKPVLDADNKPILGNDGKPTLQCNTTAAINPTQINLLKSELAKTNREVEVAQAEVSAAEATIKSLDVRPLETELAKADAAYRAAINKSQLHSYTAMITGKAVSEVSEGDVKNLEKYLIIIPSIAAAFASTLIAITAVRRIKPSIKDPPIQLPDEAMTHLFGPLITAIQKEASDAVNTAMAKAKYPAPESKTA